ncbi:MAG TPA: type IV toxin-antitoxin system AbiEi family antitoxin domain-containing protein [Amycolatopsis sp.]|nr:type IV toxin-antitoxin system AbiEi family antitoxin domain-containing protein [Amycolatopsis sp.]
MRWYGFASSDGGVVIGTGITLAQLPPTFTTREAEECGVSRVRLLRLKRAGVLVELSRGVYRKADAPETAHVDLLAISRRVQRAVVCLVSALALHDLTDEVPVASQFAVPRSGNLPVVRYPPAEFVRFDPATFELGIETFEVSPGESIPAYSAARSVVDVMRLRHRVGEGLALQALRRYVTRPQARVTELVSYGQQLGVEGPVRNAIEVILS